MQIYKIKHAALPAEVTPCFKKKRKSRKYLTYCWLYTLHFGLISDSFKRGLWDVKSVKLVNITVIIWLKVPTEEFINSFQK